MVGGSASTPVAVAASLWLRRKAGEEPKQKIKKIDLLMVSFLFIPRSSSSCPKPGGKLASRRALSIRGRIVPLGQQGVEKQAVKGSAVIFTECSYY